jgi:hypothetical protein
MKLLSFLTAFLVKGKAVDDYVCQGNLCQEKSYFVYVSLFGLSEANEHRYMDKAWNPHDLETCIFEYAWAIWQNLRHELDRMDSKTALVNNKQN